MADEKKVDLAANLRKVEAELKRCVSHRSYLLSRYEAANRRMISLVKARDAIANAMKISQPGEPK